MLRVGLGNVVLGYKVAVCIVKLRCVVSVAIYVHPARFIFLGPITPHTIQSRNAQHPITQRATSSIMRVTSERATRNTRTAYHAIVPVFVLQCIVM